MLHPTDWESVELALATQTAIEHLSLPYDPASRRLFGVPVTTSNAQAAGVGHVIASGAVALDTDTRGVDVQWSENATADRFGKNLVFARCESRYATSVFSPLGVCQSRPDRIETRPAGGVFSDCPPLAGSYHRNTLRGLRLRPWRT